MKKGYLIALAAVVGFGLSAALAQTVNVPIVAIINPTDIVPVIPFGQPTARTYYANPAQITSQSGYQKQSPATGFTYTFGNSQSYMDLTHSTTLASGTVVLASAPSDGARECIWAQNAVTTFVLSAVSTQTIHNGVTTLSAAAGVCYLYSLNTASWDRD